MIKLILKYFWLLFIFGIILGMLFPSLKLISPYLTYILMFVLFLSSLKMDTAKLFKRIKELKLLIFLVSFILIIIPIFLYLIFKGFLDLEYSLAILILLVMPSGMTVPVYSTILNGDKELALIIVILTSLLCPITIPFLLHFLVGVQITINSLQIFYSLSVIIFIPLILSILLKKVGKNFIEKTKKYYSPLSIILIMFIITGAIAKANVIQAIGGAKEIIYPFFLLFVLAILMHLIGYFILYKMNKEVKIASSLTTAYKNSTLAIVFAAQFFSAKTLLLVTLYQIPTNLILIGFGYLVKKRFIFSKA